jgi:hypothetical protein
VIFTVASTTPGHNFELLVAEVGPNNHPVLVCLAPKLFQRVVAALILRAPVLVVGEFFLADYHLGI